MDARYGPRRRAGTRGPGSSGRTGVILALAFVLVALAVVIPVGLALDALRRAGEPSAPAVNPPTPAPIVSGATPTPPGQADPVQAAQATAVAQQLLDALAQDRWADARSLLVTGRYSDTDVERAYPFLVDGTVSPLQTWALDPAQVDLRSVLVLHEDVLNGARTRAVCARWVVDTVNRKVRVRGEKELATERGTADPAAVAGRVGPRCIDVPLA